MGTEAAMEWRTVTVVGAPAGEVVPVLLGERLLRLGLAAEEMGAITEVRIIQTSLNSHVRMLVERVYTLMRAFRLT